MLLSCSQIKQYQRRKKHSTINICNEFIQVALRFGWWWCRFGNVGAGAWYAMYQNQEQARRSAQEYASQIEKYEKNFRMSLSETDDNWGELLVLW
jgi:hypothetical protein